MSWYIAKLVFQIICGNGNHTPQFDEQLRLIAAEHEKEAFSKAKQIGIKENDSFLNASSETVKWQFIDVVELTKVNAMKDGMELHSRIEETEDASRYINFMHQKSNFIETNLLTW